MLSPRVLQPLNQDVCRRIHKALNPDWLALTSAFYSKFWVERKG
jgi:hypothetical protein